MRYWSAYYSIYDIDRNGVPELFVHAGPYAAATQWYGYTVKSGKLVFLGRFGAGYDLIYGSKSGQMYTEYGHMGCLRISKWNLKNGKVAGKTVVSDTQELKGWPKASKYAKKHRMKARPYSSVSDTSQVDKLVVVSRPYKAKASVSRSGNRSLTAKASTVKNATGYQFKIAKDKNFKKGVKSKVTKKKSFKFTKLAKHRYYVKVRAYRSANGVKVYGPWSTVKSLKVR